MEQPLDSSVLDIEGRLAETAVRQPDHPAIVWQDRAITYADLARRVANAAAELQGGGVGVGDRVAIQVGNVPAFVEAWYATQRIGAVAVPLSTALAADEVAHALEDSGAGVFVVATTVAPAMVDVALELDLAVIVVGEEAPPGTRRWAELVAGDAVPDPVEVADDDLAALVYTSGTTGRPRGAMLTRRSLRANQDQSLAGRFRVTGDDLVLLVLPLSHIYALNVGLGACVRMGATVVLQERFDPVGTIEVIQRHQVTILLGAPTMYVAWNALPSLPDDAFASVRLAASGAAPLAVRTLEEFRDRTGLVIEEGYGLTEASPAVTSNTMAPAARAGTVGQPLPGIELRLVEVGGDGQAEDVLPGDPGEVWVRGPNVFAGYYRDPEATAATLTSEGWLRTGDIGVLDDDGYLRLVDRDSDLVIVSGFNVYPREVERVLTRHDAVAACAVVGIPHPYTGEAVKAVVVPTEERAGEVSEEELVDFCAAHLARYKCPETIEFVPALPYTASGKIRRIALRES